MTVTTTIFGMIISHMELQCIVYMTVGLDFLSTGPNRTPLEVPGHLQGMAMHTACCIAGPLTGEKHPLLLVGGGWDRGALKDLSASK